MHLKKILESEYLALAILVMITLPVIVHTRTLLLEITQFQNAPAWVRELYAWFFAVAFDCSIFMFAVYRKKQQAKAFALMGAVTGWMFWNMDIVATELWLPGANLAQLLSRLLIGTLWAGFSAYLVYWCSETFAERLAIEEKTLIGEEPDKAFEQKLKLVEPDRETKPVKKTKRAEEAMFLKEQGKSIKEIAAAIGVSTKTVQRDLESVIN